MKAKKLLRFIEAWFTLAWVDIQVSFIPYRYWRNELIDGIQAVGAAAINPKVRPIVAICESATRYHWRHMNCLRRCFAQQRMLKRRNIIATLHVGVTKNAGQLAAHSWLSYKGRVINDSDDVLSAYTELQTDTASPFPALLK